MTDNTNYHELWNPTPQEQRPPSRRQDVPAEDKTVVTQDELHELLRLERQRDRHTQLRNSIRQRLLNGAEVEPGLRHARIVVREIIRFSQRTFQRLYGDDWVEEQREKIPPEVHREMVVEDGGVPDPLGE